MKVATFILLADPQIDWTGRAKDVGNLDILNRGLNQISAVDYINSPDINVTCSGPVGKPDAVFFAGDLTNWGGHVDPREAILMEFSAAEVHGGDLLQDFRSLYDPAWAGNKVKQLNASGPLYFGLGNHDLESFNNPILSWPDFNGIGSTDYRDYYRHQMWNFINQMHVGYHRTLFSNPRAKYFAVDPRFAIPPDNIDADPAGTFYFQDYSFNYMIDLGPIDVYQLHLFGGDARHRRKSGLDWLKRKLATRGYTRPVFIVQHIPMTVPDTDYWDDAARDQLLEILRPYNVVGFGVGHWHGAHDLVEISTLTVPGVDNQHHMYQIQPGAAYNRRFAVIRVEETTDGVMTNVLYGRVDSSSAQAVWEKGWNFATPKIELYVKDIEVVHLDGTVDDASHALPWYVTEENRKSANVNEGFGTRGVYIKPLLTSDPAEAATGFEILIQAEPYNGTVTSVQDLADGAGEHRYLVPKRVCGEPPVTQLFLWRTDRVQAPRLGWKLSSDLNEGRGSPLYLEWKVCG